MMFKGQYRHNLDDKGRLVLPSKFRDQLGEGSVITTGLDGCLTIYTKEGWDQFTGQILSRPTTLKAVRSMMRVLSANASDVEIDKCGRIKVPDYLLEDAGISKDVTIVGVGSDIEIWATDRWLKEQQADRDEFEELSEQLYYLDSKRGNE